MSDSLSTVVVDRLREELNDLAVLKTSWEGRSIDDTLQSLVHLVNQSTIEFSLTLTIGGSLVCGTLIPWQTYYESLSSGLVSAPGSKSSKAVELVQELISSLVPPDTKPDELMPAPQFIHLKNARIYSGTDEGVPATGALWRAKIAAVDGFFMGQLASPKN